MKRQKKNQTVRNSQFARQNTNFDTFLTEMSHLKEYKTESATLN